MIAVEMGFLSISVLSDGYVEKQPVAWREFRGEYWLEKLKKAW